MYQHALSVLPAICVVGQVVRPLATTKAVFVAEEFIALGLAAIAFVEAYDSSLRDMREVALNEHIRLVEADSDPDLRRAAIADAQDLWPDRPLVAVFCYENEPQYEPQPIDGCDAVYQVWIAKHGQSFTIRSVIGTERCQRSSSDLCSLVVDIARIRRRAM